MKRLLLATRNPIKYVLFGPVFRRHGFEVLTLREAQLGSGPGPEVGQTPLENALARARRYHSAAYPWVFGDDAAFAARRSRASLSVGAS